MAFPSFLRPPCSGGIPRCKRFGSLRGEHPPEKRKVDSSILSLTTSPEETYAALTSGNISYRARLRTLLLARSNPLVTVDRRTLVHAECTWLGSQEVQCPRAPPGTGLRPSSN